VFLGNAQVLGQNAARCVGLPLGDQECLIFREVSVVEDEKELGAVRKSLDRMRHTSGHKPHAALF